jgi:two-component system cell cycle response regulator PopA
LPVQARVLIVAKDDRLAGPLCDGLDRLGWPTVTARGPNSAMVALADLGIEAIAIDLASFADTEVDAYALARRLRKAGAPRSLPVIALGRTSEGGAFDLAMAPPIHPAQAALRFEQLVRAAVAEEEVELRAATFAERGRVFDPPEINRDPYRVLTIGEPAPRFLALSNALGAMGAETVAAFTSFTAFDYLHERPFDAVVLWAGDSATEALSITAGMRRNTRLFHIPAVLVLARGSGLAMSEAFHRGVSDLAEAEESPSEVAARVMELARAHRRAAAIRHALERARTSGLMDPVTGLFTADLFASHVTRLAAAARERHRPLTVCVLRVADTPELAHARATGWLDRALPQIGSMIGRLVRAEDTAARLGPELFALALPATGQAASRPAADRIAAVIGCTAFDAGPQRKPFVVDFDIGVAEIAGGENAVQALERAAHRASLARAG